jgi:hypothetical protein
MDPHKPRIHELRTDKLGKKAADPFFVAMQYVLDALIAEPCKGLPPEEKVKVTFDRPPLDSRLTLVAAIAYFRYVDYGSQRRAVDRRVNLGRSARGILP